MPSEVFSAVAAESRGRRWYSDALHSRVDGLVQEWLDTRNGRRQICTSATEAHFQGHVTDCTEYVQQMYADRYGMNACGIPVIGVLLWPIIGGLISWLVQRTLDRMFPKGRS